MDIDIQSEIFPEDEALTKVAVDQGRNNAGEESSNSGTTSKNEETLPSQGSNTGDAKQEGEARPNAGKFSTLATPAVRHAAKKHGVNVSSITGTGKDGRVMKEDVKNHVSSREATTAPAQTSQVDINSAQTSQQPASTIPNEPPPLQDRMVPLTPTQLGMYKAMTASLSIPHFLYSSTVDLTALTALRHTVNKSAIHSFPSSPSSQQPKLTFLPFLLKALSLALIQHPILNARLEIPEKSSKPTMHYRGAHNLGLAVDTPSGLLVPVIPSVQSESVTTLASQITHFATLARSGKLQPKDMQGATFTVSNIGSVGNASVVAPVIVEGQVGILGVGRSKIVPAFGEKGELVAREECVLSWSADHRIVDGGTVARCAEYVRSLLENPGQMLVQMR